MLECPEGVASYYLGLYANRPDMQEAAVETLTVSVLPYFLAPVLLRRVQLGGWPAFGVEIPPHIGFVSLPGLR